MKVLKPLLMKRFNFAAKAQHVGLPVEHDQLELPSQVCKFLDAGLCELPEHVMQRLQQCRSRAISVLKCQDFTDPLADKHA